MIKLLALSSLLAACTIDYSGPEAPDAAVGVDAVSVVYPCNVQHETCAAAKAAAEVICDRRYQCDRLYDPPRVACIASVMETLCSFTTCNVSPYKRAELDACLATYAAASCSDGVTDCAL